MPRRKQTEIETRLAYRPRELVALLGLGRTGAYVLARVLGRRVGRSIVVPRAALLRWLEGGP